MFDDLEQKNTPTEANPGGQNDNLQSQAGAIPTPTAQTAGQPSKVEDIFSETEKPDVFKPKQTSTVDANNFPTEKSGAGIKKIIILVVIIIALVLFVWAMFLVFKYVNSSLEKKSNEPSTTQDIFFPPEIISDEIGPPTNNNDLNNIDGIDSANEDIDNLDNKANVQPIDSDQDGLSDEDEYLLGTDINSVDTDIDGLFDREEVEVYKTNPLDADTDGDGYLDGDEVGGGYNPNGPGKLYEIGTDTN